MDNSAKKTVLIVDDMELNREVLSAILKDKYRILEAQNGKRAWDIMRREGQRISLILLDIIMPVMDGFSFLKYMHKEEKYRNIPIIFVTSEANEANIQEGVRMGVSDVIVKPFDPYLVSSRVDHLIELTAKRREAEIGAEPVHAQKTGPKRTARTALIVDDVALNREILSNMLSGSYDILEASDGKEALNIIENKAADIAVVLLDIIMPVMDGVEMMSQVKSRKLLEKTPIIAITAEDSLPKINRIKEMGICEVIHKPFNPGVVKNRVNYIVELYRGGRRL